MNSGAGGFDGDARSLTGLLQEETIDKTDRFNEHGLKYNYKASTSTASSYDIEGHHSFLKERQTTLNKDTSHQGRHTFALTKASGAINKDMSSKSRDQYNNEYFEENQIEGMAALDPAVACNDIEGDDDLIPFEPLGPTQWMSPMERILPILVRKQCRKNESPTYQIPFVLKNVDVNNKSRICQIGGSVNATIRQKTIIIIGLGQSGKTTLVETLLNAILQVHFNDHYRLSIADGKPNEKANPLPYEDYTKTNWITIYQLHPVPGGRVPYQLNIVDTPGYCTKSVERLRECLQNGTVPEVNSIAFVVKASSINNLYEYKAMYNSLVRLFGNDIVENISLVLTFADTRTNTLLDVLKANGIQFRNDYIFNNCSLYTCRADQDKVKAKLSSVFWDVCQASVADLLTDLASLSTKSLVLNKKDLETIQQIDQISEREMKQLSNYISQVVDIILKHSKAKRENKEYNYQTSLDKTLADIQERFWNLVCILNDQYQCTKTLKCYPRPTSQKMVIEALYDAERYKCLNHHKMRFQLVTDVSVVSKTSEKSKESTCPAFWTKYAKEKEEFSDIAKKSDMVSSSPGKADGDIKKRFCEAILPFCIKQEQREKKMRTHKLPLHEKYVNHEIKSRTCQFGSRSHNLNHEKHILMIGATGSGKSTLIDGFINYILGVDFEDDFRFSIIDLKENEKAKVGNQAQSQTEWITVYEINPIPDGRIPYTLNIIDTPGFGDTQGLQKDKELIERLRCLFSEEGETGVHVLDCVAFVAQAALCKLTHSQIYIFDSILSIFDKSISENINMFLTFADGDIPPILEALEEGKVYFNKDFVFNNSGLFSLNKGKKKLTKMFWDMGQESFQEVFSELDKMEPKSLTLTAEVLENRQCIELIIQHLQTKIKEGLEKLQTLKLEKSIFEHVQETAKENRNYTYTVNEQVQEQYPLEPGKHVTNCLVCNFTCHYPCFIPMDENKYNCSAMNHSERNVRKRLCSICPNKCSWNKHANFPHRYETKTVRKERTYQEMKARYEKALEGKAEKEGIIEALGNDFRKTQREVGEMIEEVRERINHLDEIAMRRNPLTATEYLEMMIKSEQAQQREGYRNRIKMLEDAKEQAQLMSSLRHKDFDPWSKYLDQNDQSLILPQGMIIVEKSSSRTFGAALKRGKRWLRGKMPFSS